MLTGIDIIGTVGAAILVLGWLPQTYKTLKEHRTSLHPAFAALYFIGSGILVEYSLLINSPVFAALNLLAAAQAMVNLYYSRFNRSSRAKEKKGRKGR